MDGKVGQSERQKKERISREKGNEKKGNGKKGKGKRAMEALKWLGQNGIKKEENRKGRVK